MSFLNFTLPFPATLAIAAVIPMILGMIWYNPKGFGTAWMTAIGKTHEDMQKGFNPAIVYPLAYIFSFFLAFALNFIVIHQWHLFSMVQNQQADLQNHSSQLSMTLVDMYHRYGTNFRTFRHGALHGTIAGVTFALPIVATSALFERKGFKYTAINAGYWILCCMLMGAFICHFQTANYMM
jgi:hypothetical protein